jgi:5-carboxymethyl-2-hydroxymuconate isomerase
LPHLTIEFSDNLEAAIDIAGLVDAMHDTAVTLDPLPTGGIRTRAVARKVFKIADGHADNGFISVILRIAKGRTDEEKQAVGEALFVALTGYVQDVFDRRPLSLALEIQEIDPATRWKQSNIRDYMEKRRDPGRN